MIISNNYEALTPGSHKHVTIQCDSGKNSKCLNIFDREYRILYKQRKRTGGKDYCKFCQKTEEYTGRSNPNTQYFFDDNYLTNIDSPDKAYLLGWIASDGSISETGEITIGIKDEDVDVLKALRSLLDPAMPLYDKPNTNITVLRICSTTMSEDCIRHLGLLGPGSKHRNIKLPSIPIELMPFFLRGYFEGDGHVGLHGAVPRVSIYSNSIDMLNSIREVLGRGKIYSYDNGSVIEFNSGESALYFLNYIYENTEELPIVLDRKYSKYLEYKDWKPSLSYKYVKYGNFNVKVNKLNTKAIIPTVSDSENSGLDLHLIEKVKDLSFDVELYTTGLRLTPPPGYYFIIVPRSSISKTIYSLANSVGIIDENYRGEIMVALRRSTSAPVHGMELPCRIVQAILVPKVELHVSEETEYEDTARGAGGFGSTGS